MHASCGCQRHVRSLLLVHAATVPLICGSPAFQLVDEAFAPEGERLSADDTFLRSFLLNEVTTRCLLSWPKLSSQVRKAAPFMPLRLYLDHVKR